MLWDANSQKPVNQENLERLHVTAQHLDGLIRDVLDLARDEMGELKLACEPLDMAKILEAVVLVGEQLARERGLELASANTGRSASGMGRSNQTAPGGFEPDQ